MIDRLRSTSSGFMSLALLAGLLVMTAGTSPAVAGGENQYPNGIEGIKAASVPPPGLYYKLYSVFYSADMLADRDGNDLNVDFDLDLFASAHRVLWVSDMKVLGGDFGMDIIIPFFDIDVEIGAAGISASQTGIGDIWVEPIVIGWHGARYDSVFALGFCAPTGDYDMADPASPGKDMWTYMASAGVTLYLDPTRSWSASALARYERHDSKRDLDIRPGDDLHVEWGIGKSINKVWDVGVAGYAQWQVSDDSVSGVAGFGDRDEVMAIGPEVAVFIPAWKAFFSLRALWEYGAQDRSEGQITTLSFTKIF